MMKMRQCESAHERSLERLWHSPFVKQNTDYEYLHVVVTMSCTLKIVPTLFFFMSKRKISI